MKEIILFVILLLASCLLIITINNVNYFETPKNTELETALKSAGVDTCSAFLEKYFNSKDNKATLTFRAFAYERGLCASQDITKAADLYEQSVEDKVSYVSAEARLALIYTYGPLSLRNRARAQFLFRQVALSSTKLDLMSDEFTREEYMRIHLGGKPLPKDLKKAWRWVDDILKLDIHARKALNVKLQAEGFQDTGFLSTSQEKK